MYFLQVVYAKLYSWKFYGFYDGSTGSMLTLLGRHKATGAAFACTYCTFVAIIQRL